MCSIQEAAHYLANKYSSSQMIPTWIRWNNNMRLAFATTFSLLITFGLHSLSSGHRVSNSLFQHVVADTLHHTCLFCRCMFNEQSRSSRKKKSLTHVSDVDHTICRSLTIDDTQNAYIIDIGVLAIVAVIWHYGSRVVPGFFSCALTILNVWLLARWCDSLSLWYPVDTVTVHLVIWQLSYVVFHWCFHQLSWPFVFLYQASICLLTATYAFVLYEFALRYVPSAVPVMVWFVAFEDV